MRSIKFFKINQGVTFSKIDLCIYNVQQTLDIIQFNFDIIIYILYVLYIYEFVFLKRWTTHFHLLLFAAFALQSWISIPLRSSYTFLYHIFLGLPFLLIPTSLQHQFGHSSCRLYFFVLTNMEMLRSLTFWFHSFPQRFSFFFH